MPGWPLTQKGTHRSARTPRLPGALDAHLDGERDDEQQKQEEARIGLHVVSVEVRRLGLEEEREQDREADRTDQMTDQRELLLFGSYGTHRGS